MSRTEIDPGMEEAAEKYQRLLLVHAKARDLADDLLEMDLVEEYAQVLGVAQSLGFTRNTLLPTLLPGEPPTCPDCGERAIVDAPGYFRCEPCGIGWCHAG